mgnify:CR=1 FL=1|jgi:hypothetical protein
MLFKRVSAFGYKPSEMDESGLGYLWLDEMAKWLTNQGTLEGLTDMELGTGIYWAKALLDADIRVTANLSCWEQPKGWTDDERRTYRGILDHVVDVSVVGKSRPRERADAWIRNKKMVESSDLVLFILGDETAGIVYKTQQYAEELGKPWLKYNPRTNVVSGSEKFLGEKL